MKFSIRDLLLVTVIVGLALGWWMDRNRIAKHRQDKARLLEEVLAREGWKVSENERYLQVLSNSPSGFSPTPNGYIFDLSALNR